MNYNNKLYLSKLAVIGVVLVLMSFNLFSQNDSLNIKDYSIFKKNHWTFSATPHLLEKSNIIPFSDGSHINSKSSFSTIFGVTHTFNIKNKHGILIGIKTGKVKNKISFNIEDDANGISMFHNETHETASYFSFPILYEYRFYFKERLLINTTAGINIRHNIARDPSFRVTMLDPPFEYREEYDHLGVDYLNYNIGGGVLYKLKNNNLIRMNIVSNISFYDELFGVYAFSFPGNESYGANVLRMSYIGLELGFTFTRAKRKSQEKE